MHTVCLHACTLSVSAAAAAVVGADRSITALYPFCREMKQQLTHRRAECLRGPPHSAQTSS
eukprot:1071-Heterococcus_DN1.PRE.4